MDSGTGSSDDNVGDVQSPDATVPLAGGSRGDNETAESAAEGPRVDHDDPRAGPSKRRRNNESDELDEDIRRPKVAQLMMEIRAREAAGKEKRMAETLDTLERIHGLGVEGVDRRLNRMLEFFQTAYRKREELETKRHQEKLNLIRGVCAIREDEKDFVSRGRLKEYTPSGESSDDLDFVDTNNVKEDETFKREFEKYKDFLLEDNHAEK